MLYSAITWPSRLKTNLAMCFAFRVQPNQPRILSKILVRAGKRVHDVRHDHRDVVPATIVIRQLNQLLSDRIQISTKGAYR